MGKGETDSALGLSVLCGSSLVEILGFLEIKDIFAILLRVNKWTHLRILEENFVFLWKLVRMLNIPVSFEASDLPFRENIIAIIKRTYSILRNPDMIDLEPFAYSTDGGTYSNSQ